MKRRLTLLMTALFIPILLLAVYGVSENYFSLSMRREQERAQAIQALIAKDIRSAVQNLPYDALADVARQYQNAYAGQSMRLIFLYNNTPLAGATLPNRYYNDLLNGQRSAMLDTRSTPQQYAIAEPLNARITLLVLKDVSDLYLLRGDMRRMLLLYASAGCAIVAGLAYLLASRFVKPVHQLTLAAKQISADTSATVQLPTSRRDELGSLASAFADMQQTVQSREMDLMQQSKRRQAFLDAMAHEMRTPLCAMLGNARLLQHEALPASQRSSILSTMVDEIKRLSAMDSQLLKLTQLEHVPLQWQPVAMLPLLQATAARLMPQANGVVLLVVGEASTILGDPDLLTILADNLTANAIRASTAGNSVTLRTLSNGFSVEDHGCGLTASELSSAMEPFYKADKARSRSAGGVGLGLALCRQIAVLHGATLSLASKENIGTTATFTTSLQPVADSVTAAGVSYVQEVTQS